MTMFDENPCVIQDQPATPWLGKTPLVLIHDGGGTVFSYHLIGPLKRRVFGISNPCYTTGSTWDGGINQMANHYYDLIKKIIPFGKVILGGWSLGGILSIAIARLIADDDNLDVVGILMIDSICPRPTTVQAQALAQAEIRTQQAKPTPTPIAQHALTWSTYTKPETRNAVQRCFSEAVRMLGEWTLPSWPNDSFTRPPPVILLRCKEKVPTPDGTSRVDSYRDDPLLGWGHYRQDLISQVVEIPGNHFSIWATEERLDEVTAKINQACLDLDAAQALGTR
ncbi:Alpha/Beta hydrolase protein [Bombardia bombarda]|uniref:Alpha/Beta hydrolase protein n=1 Tax=Bombardia bombarda TaxID=252184 RepID=A0AA39XMK7_9PEZI|nr:Alpha/Beta hydrolase protein [Bombardia bombarda]